MAFGLDFGKWNKGISLGWIRNSGELTNLGVGRVLGEGITSTFYFYFFLLHTFTEVSFTLFDGLGLG